MYTKEQFEQFKRQCIEESKDDSFISRWTTPEYALSVIADRISDIPLPVTPEQAEPVAKYEVKWEKIRSQCLDTDELTSLMQEEIDAHRKNSSTLLARIAELEAENQKLKEGK